MSGTIIDNGVPRPDLSNHLSHEARSRLPNPMKSLLATEHKPGVISLAMGDPHPSLFPLRKVVFEVPSVAEPDPVVAWRNGTGPSQAFTSYKDNSNMDPSLLSLESAFQYTHGAGLPHAQQVLAELTKFFHSPPADHVVTMSLGNADGVSKAFRMLGEKGDHFITDNFGFPGLTNVPLSYGVEWIGAKMDEGGLVPEDLEYILKNWDYHRGRLPHVLFVVPCGQNPTGTSLSTERRKKIYGICQRYDLIIVEDDPYFFLQYDLPIATDSSTESPSRQFAKAFPPSFLSMDVDGRVIRFDSFSKILAPGLRLGWITSNRMFYEKFVTYTDSATQHPHALGQIFIAEMLGKNGWQIDGFCRWTKSLCEDYQRRRDLFLDVFRREVGSTGYATVSKPQAGMFVWIEIHLERHPRHRSIDSAKSATIASSSRTNTPALMEELFGLLIKADVVLMPASMFAIKEDLESLDMNDYVPIGDRFNFFRATFSGTEEMIEIGITRFGRVLKEFFNSANE